MCEPGGGKAGTLLGQTWQGLEAVPVLQVAPKYPPPVHAGVLGVMQQCSSGDP